MTLLARARSAYWWFLESFWYWLPIMTPVIFILLCVAVAIVQVGLTEALLWTAAFFQSFFHT